MLVESLEGQAIELGWVRDNDLTVGTDDYLRLVLKKTAWYSFIHPMRIGAMVAERRRSRISIGSIGSAICSALAFQITDDVLNLIGDVARYGKEIDGDLWEGKRTLAARARARPRRSQPTVRGSATFWRGRASGGCRARCCGSTRSSTAAAASTGRSRRRPVRAEAAAREFDGVAFAGVPPSPDLDWLRACVDFLVQRDA